VVESLARRHALREDLAENHAVDILWALTGPEVYSLFVRERQWSPDRFGDWLHGLAQEQLLAPSPQPGRKTKRPA
jgi:hypothetical protein